MTCNIFKNSSIRRILTPKLVSASCHQPRGNLFRLPTLKIPKRQFCVSTASASNSKDEDTTNVWKLTQEGESLYWHGYLTTRPKYTDDFYQLIYDYHARSSKQSFSVAHDVGA
ncbi:hypothetical protein N7490_002195 [Penicillium lividum]|nr:hypothetical protein N7490_002195 [Penicillium lividum]